MGRKRSISVAMASACQDKALENIFCISSVNSDHQNKHRANSPHCMFSQSQHEKGGVQSRGELLVLCPCCIDEVKQVFVLLC